MILYTIYIKTIILPRGRDSLNITHLTYNVKGMGNEVYR